MYGVKKSQSKSGRNTDRIYHSLEICWGIIVSNFEGEWLTNALDIGY